MKIHYRNRHGTTNLPWQNAFRKYGDLSLGSVDSKHFPKQIDHLHLGGSCKGKHSNSSDFITVDLVKKIQRDTNCSISCFYGDAWLNRFQFHHDLLDASIPKLKVYSAALYATPQWRSDVTWVPHPTDPDIFHLVPHKKNNTILFIGHLTTYRAHIITQLSNAGIKVDVIGNGGNISPQFGARLVDQSQNYTISIGMAYNPYLPKVRYFSSRLPDCLAMGLTYIETDFDLTALFKPNELIQWYNFPDLVHKIHYYQNHPQEGQEISMIGRDKVLDNWTFTKLAERFIKEGIY